MFLTALTTWIRGLLAVAILVAAGLLIREWVDRLPRYAVPSEARISAAGTPPERRALALNERIVAWSRDPDGATGPLIAAGLLLLLAFGGRVLSPRLWKRQGPVPVVVPERMERLETRPGRALHVLSFGPADAPPIVLVHGLGSDHTQWFEAIQDLSGSFRVVVYDLFGHGRSTHRRGEDHSLEAMARDLDSVLAWTGERRVVLAGHSMGGMIALTWLRTNRAKAHERLAGLVLAHTAPWNPFAWMAPVPLHLKLQKAVHEPLLRMTRALSPVVRVLTRLSYWNGSIHWDNELQLFAGRETREQLDRSARIAAGLDPAAQAACALELTRYNAADVLGSIGVPALVVAGDKDGVLVPEASEEITRRVRGCASEMLEPARHLGLIEQREEFAEAVRDLAGSARPERRERRVERGVRTEEERAVTEPSRGTATESPKRKPRRRSASSRQHPRPAPTPRRP